MPVLPLLRQYAHFLPRNIALPPETHGGSTQVGHGVHEDNDGNASIGVVDVSGAVNVAEDGGGGGGGGGKKRHAKAPSEDWTRLQPHASTGERGMPLFFISCMRAF